jgi:hypothetical protein
MAVLARTMEAAILCASLGLGSSARSSDEPAIAHAAQLVADGDYERAIATLEPLVRTLAGDPQGRKQLAQVHLWLGVALLLGEDDERAATGHFREAVRHDPEIAPPTPSPPRVTRAFETGRDRALATQRSEARAAAWAEIDRHRTSGDRAGLVAALQAFVKDFQEPSPQRTEAERLLKEVRDKRARLLIESAPDPVPAGRKCKATYVSGKAPGIALGTTGTLLLGDAERLVFLVRPGGAFHAVPYSLVKNMESGLSKERRNAAAGLVSPFLLLGRGKSRHYIAITYEDLAGERQSVVLELAGGDLRPAMTLMEMRVRESNGTKPPATTGQ